MKVDVIIPAFNEAKHIKDTLESINRLSWVNEIIVVDDGSCDETYSIAKLYCTKVLQHKHNKGKMTAVFTGLSYVRGEWIMILDADLGSTACEAQKLLPAIQNNVADMTVAIFPEFSKKGFGIVKRRVRNVILRKTGKRLLAPLSGQRCFHRRWIPFIVNEKGYGFGLEMLMNIVFLNNGAVIKEIQTNMNHRLTGKNMEGFYHRAKQWLEMEKTLWNH
ncbi:glycosyltransferase family 2 protein [Evansella sp. AB-rgal1]|uniref:glycosyltransferase family 2 protein n=1 Tax=Evansella sp. AB-rgal1 TaxID=3242696 RepID=UPI00359E6EB0